MKSNLLSRALTIMAIVLPLATSIQAQLTLDEGGERTIQFTGEFVFLSEAPVETIEGTAVGATGEISTDTSDLTKTRGVITVPVSSMKTGNKKRDKHLSSKNWLDAKEHPEIRFEIKSVEVGRIDDSSDVKTAELEATGDFSLHGVTKEIAIPLTLKWKGDAVKVSADFNVGLADFEIKGAKGIVGERVGESIALTANLTGTAK